MPLIRLIAVTVIFWLLYRLILTLLSKARRSSTQDQQAPHGERMVRCEQCGLHIPRGEAIVQGEKYYCCEAHRDADDAG